MMEQSAAIKHQLSSFYFSSEGVEQSGSGLRFTGPRLKPPAVAYLTTHKLDATIRVPKALSKMEA